MDFGVGQDAKRSADIRSDLGQASNADQQQNQRNPGGREAEGQLAASLLRYSPLPGDEPHSLLAIALLPLRATHPGISNSLLGDEEVLDCFGDFFGMCFQREVAGVEETDGGIWNVAFEGLGT